jgi:hypothetical protein
MAKNNVTNNVIRITTGPLSETGKRGRWGKSQAIADDNGTSVVTCVNRQSAFGPQNEGNVYTLRIRTECIPAGLFDMRNADSGLWLGTWEVVAIPGNYMLWDATDVPAEKARNAARTVPSATLSVAPAVPAMLSGLIAAGRTSSVTTRRIQPIGAFRA